MKAREFDDRFDAGEDVTNALDLKKARRLKQEPKRIDQRRQRKRDDGTRLRFPD